MTLPQRIASKFYQKYFNGVDLDDHPLWNFSPDKFNVCPTPGNGYANNHKYMLSLLKKCQLPAPILLLQ